MVTDDGDNRDLTPAERAVLVRILDGSSFLCSQGLRAQLEGARGICFLPTIVHLKTDLSVPATDCPDGPIPVRAIVLGSDGIMTGESLVWVHGGRLSSLEYGWVTDEMPTAFPDPERIQLEAH